MEVLFATNNERKIIEASDTLVDYGIVVQPTPLHIDEIQHADSAEIAKAKARAAYATIRKPVVVSDTSWSIPSLGGFPGGYMKDVSAWLSAEDWLALMARHTDRTIYCHEHIAYSDGQTLNHFVTTYRGVIAPEARGRERGAESIERVAILYGDKTMAEYLEEGAIASAGEILDHWKQFGAWYKNTQNTP